MLSGTLDDVEVCTLTTNADLQVTLDAPTAVICTISGITTRTQSDYWMIAVRQAPLTRHRKLSTWQQMPVGDNLHGTHLHQRKDILLQPKKLKY